MDLDRLITVLLTGAAVAVTLATTPVYTARAQVYVSVRTGETTTDLLQGSSFSQRQVKSYTDLASTPLVLTPVIEHLDLATTPDTLAESVSADSPLDTSLINIRASDPDPQTASDIANAVAESLAEQVTALEEPDEGPSPVEINTVRTASAPTEPSSPNLKLNVALGLLLGLAAGFGLAILREVLDTRVRTVDDVRSVTTASILTSMAHDEESVGKSWWSRRTRTARAPRRSAGCGPTCSSSTSPSGSPPSSSPRHCPPRASPRSP